MPSSHTILVTGATGRQGSATIRALLALSTQLTTPLTIHALVRNPSSARAQALAALSPSIKLFAGTFEDGDSLTAAARSCTALFLLTVPNPHSPDTELAHARAVLAAAKNARTVQRVVYSSASLIGAEEAYDELERWPGMAWYMRAKRAVEEAVLGAGFSAGATVLRPAMLWTNFVGGVAGAMYPGLKEEGVLRTALEPGHRVGCLDPADVGAFAARALVEYGDVGGEVWRDRVVPLASRRMTMGEMAEGLTRAVGGRRRVSVVQISEEELGAGERSTVVESELFRNRFRVVVDLEEVRAYGVRLGTWEEFVEREREGIEVALGLA
ncbi:uncharacterized protein K452DRAFT_268497 [Aplosporella prunicola CBS 121167]|uniref:NmrA-like domain-containing protein n=1 Tax=Aplosporella prunicola CBS 121167 TaxID=1176127 RepID=A0A6A6BIM1_9PEZI|nr:uncharacterized protein K452DRAFT_268497 [Aplosporella prunicola CBS 121167]KAF2143165.1 hypothetical protein K452DRAFT_268497 [Aplosporella prunicola CBS 121167]